LEQRPIKISNSELKQPSGNGPGRSAHILTRALVTRRQAGGDESDQVFDRATPDQLPGMRIFEQLPHRAKFSISEIDRGTGRRSHQPTQTIRPAKPSEPVFSRACEVCCQPVHWQSNKRWANPTLDEPCEHRKRISLAL
jgi:hypothetical protein